MFSDASGFIVSVIVGEQSQSQTVSTVQERGESKGNRTDLSLMLTCLTRLCYAELGNRTMCLMYLTFHMPMFAVTVLGSDLNDFVSR